MTGEGPADQLLEDELPVLYQSLCEFLKAEGQCLSGFQMHSEVKRGERGQMKSDSQASLITMDKFHVILQCIWIVQLNDVHFISDYIHACLSVHMV